MKKMKRIHKVVVITICLLLSVWGVILQIQAGQESKNLIGNYFKSETILEQQMKENNDGNK